jgi:hypothetical protein
MNKVLPSFVKKEITGWQMKKTRSVTVTEAKEEAILNSESELS